jgi:hypothetical protein
VSTGWTFLFHQRDSLSSITEHVKVYAVDRGAGWKTLEKASETGDIKTIAAIKKARKINTVAMRNKFMSDKIQVLMETVRCRKIIHVGGIHHLSLSEDSNNGLGKLINSKGVRTVSIGLQPTSDYFNFGEFIPTALRCRAGTASFNKGESGFGIRAKEMDGSLTMPDKDGRGSRWSDFDAILFFPTTK